VTRTGSFCGGDLGVRKFLTTLTYSRTENTASAVLYSCGYQLIQVSLEISSTLWSMIYMRECGVLN
jgi:hypothetical protein